LKKKHPGAMMYDREQNREKTSGKLRVCMVKVRDIGKQGEKD